MKKTILLSSTLIAALSLGCTKANPPQPWDDEPVRTDVQEEGYYKDIFMDAGIRLTGRTTLPSADAMGYSLEFFACPNDSLLLAREDTVFQRAIMSDSDGILIPADDNGVLLYPDGEPRFRMVYMNGGAANAHCRSMNCDGCKGVYRLRDFYNNGGSYVGSCAGAFMTGTGSSSQGTNFNYLWYWPGHPQSTGVQDYYMDMSVEPGCPLLQYYDFGGDRKIAHIRHNGGCYIRDGVPEGTEILLRYSTKGDSNAKAANNDGRISSWAYKKDLISGRMCAIGSHPEGVTSGEQLDLMCAFEKYSIAGRGIATIKDTLFNGKEIAMTKAFADSVPQHAKIGDLQNHHFAIWVPAGAKDLSVTINRLGDDAIYGECELELSIKKGTFALPSAKPESVVTGKESYKGITLTTPEKGLYYVCVHCATTVESTKTTYINKLGQTGTYFKYSGHTEVLNGVPYTIKATWTE